MNWTEGKLARHSRARQGKQGGKQTLLLRQKEHFAKARAGLLRSTSNQPPPAFAVFQPSANAHQVGDGLFPTAPHQATNPPDVFQRPRKRRLSSSSRDRASTRQCVSGNPFAQDKYEGRVHDAVVLEKKRSKLLSETDWAGVGMQKEISVHFEHNPSGKNRWTKRRRSPNSRTRRPVGDRPPGQSSKAHRHTAHHHKNQAVRITVGSQEVRLGEGSSTRQSSHAPFASEGRQQRQTLQPRQAQRVPTGALPKPQPFRGAAMPTTFAASSTSRMPASQELNRGDGPLVHTSSYITSLSDAELLAPARVRPLPDLVPLLEALVQDTDGSIVAQVGDLVPPVPASKQGENEAWRRFAGPSQSTVDHEYSTRDEQSSHPPISPGVSMWHPQLLSTAATLAARPPSAVSAPSSRCQVHSPLNQLPTHSSLSTVSQLDLHASSPRHAIPDAQSCHSKSENGSAASGNLTGDLYLRRHSSRASWSSPDGAVAALFSEALDVRSRYAQYLDSGIKPKSTDSELDSVDRRVAVLSETARKIVARRPQGSWKQEDKESGETRSRSPQHEGSESGISSPGQMPEDDGSQVQHLAPSHGSTAVSPGSETALGTHITDSGHGNSSVDVDQTPSPRETAIGILPEESPRDPSQNHNSPRDGSPGQSPAGQQSPRSASPRPGSFKTESPKPESPRKESDDIWFKYVFSDANTEELHKEVLDGAAKEAARSLQKVPESDFGQNISTAAAQGQSSMDTSESGVDKDDLTWSLGVSASHKAAIGSTTTTTQTAGSALDGWEGRGGPPYAAPTMQGLTSSETTFPSQQHNNDSGESALVTSGSTSDVPCSLSSKAVEPAQSVTHSNVTRGPLKFAPPKLFVGKLSDSVPSARPVTAVKPVTLTKPKRGRPKKKARGGRANVRSIPAFHDDPIEDFDEPQEGRGRKQARAQPSLFPALEMA